MRLLLASWLPLAIALSIVAVFLLQFMRARARRQADDSEVATPLQWLFSISPGILLLALVSLAAGVGVFYVAAYRPLLGFFTSRSWVATPCTILRSDVEKYIDSEGVEMSRLSVRYEYVVRDLRFEGSRYDFGFDGFSGGSEPKQRIAASLLPGKRTTCYVDPDLPERSVIQHGFSTGLLAILAPCVIFTGAGVGLLAMAVNEARRRTR